MKVSHHLTMIAQCPADGRLDHYDVIVECSRVIAVEKILEEVARFKDRRLYQEEVTSILAKRLRAKVITTGFHSGVKTVCES